VLPPGSDTRGGRTGIADGCDLQEIFDLLDP
jgi:hypothetical protein